mmetsp:Transcript_8606/g.24734  ORF Transcript_8606/g.24734 Transcript_8606/m.24734 type:complete len:273 (+) Transcript_8606:1021-1839(+)
MPFRSTTASLPGRGKAILTVGDRICCTVCWRTTLLSGSWSRVVPASGSKGDTAAQCSFPASQASEQATCCSTTAFCSGPEPPISHSWMPTSAPQVPWLGWPASWAGSSAAQEPSAAGAPRVLALRLSISLATSRHAWQRRGLMRSMLLSTLSSGNASRRAECCRLDSSSPPSWEHRARHSSGTWASGGGWGRRSSRAGRGGMRCPSVESTKWSSRAGAPEWMRYRYLAVSLMKKLSMLSSSSPVETSRTLAKPQRCLFRSIRVACRSRATSK